MSVRLQQKNELKVSGNIFWGEIRVKRRNGTPNPLDSAAPGWCVDCEKKKTITIIRRNDKYL
jgi:hypothetical protein